MGRHHQRMDRNEVQRVYQDGTRPKEMELYDSRPAQSRWHRMMMIKPLNLCLVFHLSQEYYQSVGLYNCHQRTYRLWNY